MSRVSNIFDDPVIGVASDLPTVTTSSPTLSDGWYTPDGDEYYRLAGPEAGRFFNIATLEGSIIVSIWADIPAGDPTANTILWDVSGDDNYANNLAFGGYGVELDLSAGDTIVNFRYRETNGAVSTLYAANLQDDYAEFGWAPPAGSKADNEYLITMIITHMDDWNDGIPFMHCCIDGNVWKSIALSDSNIATTNPDAGLVLWGTSREPADASVAKLMNAGGGDAIRTSSVYLSRVRYNAQKEIHAIYAEHARDRATEPASGNLGLR